MGNSIEKFSDQDTNKVAGYIVDEVLKDWAQNRSLDNITWIVVSFKDFIEEYSALNTDQKSDLQGEKVISW